MTERNLGEHQRGQLALAPATIPSLVGKFLLTIAMASIVEIDLVVALDQAR